MDRVKVVPKGRGRNCLSGRRHDPVSYRIRIEDLAEDENSMVESLPKGQKYQCKNVTKNGNIICGFDQKKYAVC
jgi:hypothetical protein